MKRKNPIACDEARLINSWGDGPMEPLTTGALDRHLNNLDQFKLGLRNSFGVDFRTLSYSHSRTGDDRSARPVLFNYLSEALPLLEGRVRQLTPLGIHVYEKFAESALKSFWEIYCRFQPLIHNYADRHGVDIDQLGNVLGRAILLYEKARGFKFYSYLRKTLNESVKNLRGKSYAEQFNLPLSAGRLMPQILWLLDQETLRCRTKLSPEQSDRVVIDFLSNHATQFSDATMRMVADVARTQTRSISLDASFESAVPPPSRSFYGDGDSPCDDLESLDEYEHVLADIHDAIERARFSEREQVIVLENLNLSHDDSLFARVEAELSAGSLRNRKSQLMVRFFAAFHSPNSRRFGRFLHAEPKASRPILASALRELAFDFGVSSEQVVTSILNMMSLSDGPYRVSISERDRLNGFLAETQDYESDARPNISGHLYNKLKAALIDQDRQGCPCLRHD